MLIIPGEINYIPEINNFVFVEIKSAIIKRSRIIAEIFNFIKLFHPEKSIKDLTLKIFKLSLLFICK